MIQKKIHFCWLSDDEYPPLIDYCINSWKNKLPDYEIILWDKTKIDIGSIPWIKQAYENKKYAFAADYIRLYALYYEGGVYLDSDVEVIKDFDDLLDNHSFIGFETGGDLEPAIIGAEIGCEWIGRCLDYYINREFIKADGSFDTRPLPTIVGEIIKENEIGLKIYPCEYFSPKSIHTNRIKITENTRCIHHFDGAWVNKDSKYILKNTIHKLLINLFGQSLHNTIIKRFR